MKRFSIPIFGCKIHFTQDSNEARAWADKTDSEVNMSQYDGLCVGAGSSILIYAKDMATLAHESFHAAKMILDHIGAEDHDEEVVAYLITFIVRKCAC